MRITLAILGIALLVFVDLRVLPAMFGPPLPAGATRLHIDTEPPNLSLGCASALLQPARVRVSGDNLEIFTVATGNRMTVVWPAGFAAWRVNGQAVLVESSGSVIAYEGQVLDWLGGGEDSGGRFHICPFGIVPGH